MAILFQSQPLYRFLVVAFCTFVSFEGCVCLIFIPKIIAVLYYDPVRKSALIEFFINGTIVDVRTAFGFFK